MDKIADAMLKGYRNVRNQLYKDGIDSDKLCPICFTNEIGSGVRAEGDQEDPNAFLFSDMSQPQYCKSCTVKCLKHYVYTSKGNVSDEAISRAMGGTVKSSDVKFFLKE